MMRMMHVFASGFAIALASCGGDGNEPTKDGVEAAEGNVTLRGGFVRPVTASDAATAGYTTLTSETDDVLIGADVPGFASVELHEGTEQNGVSRMRRIERIVLPAGESVILAPGGYHLMMMGPQAELAEGATVSVTFRFESGTTLTAELPVERRAGSDHDEGH